jgi:hypothetical protein
MSVTYAGRDAADAAAFYARGDRRADSEEPVTGDGASNSRIRCLGAPIPTTNQAVSVPDFCYHKP